MLHELGGRYLLRLNLIVQTDRTAKYREGKVKSTLKRELNVCETEWE